MKKLKLIGAIMISALIFVGCEKEEIANPTAILTNFEITDNAKGSKSEKVMSYYTFSCLVELPAGVQGPQELGERCSVGAVSSCDEFSECQSVSEEQVQATFTSDQIDQWRDGDLHFEQTEQFVLDHYSFFEYLYQEGRSFHPDTILARNGWN